MQLTNLTYFQARNRIATGFATQLSLSGRPPWCYDSTTKKLKRGLAKVSLSEYVKLNPMWCNKKEYSVSLEE